MKVDKTQGLCYNYNMSQGVLCPKWSGEPVVQTAMQSVQEFADNTNDPSAVAVSVDSLNLMGDFLGVAGPNAAASLALYGLAFRTGRITVGAAKRALRTFSQRVGVNSAEWMYVSGILADTISVAEQATSDETHVVPDSRMSAVLNRRLPGQSVPPGLWGEKIGFAPPRLIGELTQAVNSEVFPLLALHDAALLRQGGLSERNLYRIAYGTEALIAPVVETQRFGALASYVRSLERTARLRQLGGKAAECVETAVNIQRAYHATDETEVLKMMNGLLKAFFGPEQHTSRFVVPDTTNHGIRFAEFVASLPNFETRGQLRTKPLGNIALKLFEDGYEPVDIYGMTFVVKDAAQVSELFAHLVQKVTHLKGMKQIYSKSRLGKPYKVQGDQAFIDTVSNNPDLRKTLGERQEQLIDQKLVQAGDFRVAKFTFVIARRINGAQVTVPFEVQIQTEKDREESQIGATSHAMREAFKRGIPVEIDPKVLHEIKFRADPRTMGTLILPASIISGAEYRRRIAQTR